MPNAILLCRDPLLERQLATWLGSRCTQVSVASESGPPPDLMGISGAFVRLANWIDRQALDPETTLSGGTVAITDLAGPVVRSDKLSPLGNAGWSSVVGMLTLAYPEIHWCYVGAAGGNSQIENWPAAHVTERLADLDRAVRSVESGLRPLFDPYGLRRAIRRANQRVADTGAVVEPAALAIDEERNYALLNAYVAYRNGYRSLAINSYAAMVESLGPDGIGLGDRTDDAVLEDLFLHFHDYHPPQFSKLKARDERFPRLAKVNNRIFVTAGHANSRGELAEENERYREALRRRGTHCTVLDKPLGGMFEIWAQSRLPSLTHPMLNAEMDAAETGHSTPGKLLVVAERLIDRAGTIADRLEDELPVPRALIGAVLASDALTLLGGKTPTTTLEALRLKHLFEVVAECQFAGAAHHIDISPRMAELEGEVAAVSRWFGHRERRGPRYSRLAAWNAEMRILSSVTRVFQSYGQFDEEQSCRNRMRCVHGAISRNRSTLGEKFPRWFEAEPPWLRDANPARVLWPFHWYFETLLASLRNFLLALGLWNIGLWLGFALALRAMYPSIDASELTFRSLGCAVAAFFSVGTPPESLLGNAQPSVLCHVMICAAIVSGFIHLGIFVSHLYTVVARR